MIRPPDEETAEWKGAELHLSVHMTSQKVNPVVSFIFPTKQNAIAHEMCEMDLIALESAVAALRRIKDERRAYKDFCEQNKR